MYKSNRNNISTKRENVRRCFLLERFRFAFRRMLSMLRSTLQYAIRLANTSPTQVAIGSQRLRGIVAGEWPGSDIPRVFLRQHLHTEIPKV